MSKSVASLNNLRKAVYLIICSRGGGTETITTSNPLAQEDYPDESDDGSNELTLDNITPFDPITATDWGDRPLTERMVQEKLNRNELVIGGLDEGNVYLVPEGMTEIEFLRQALACEIKFGGYEGTSPLGSQLISALLRALIANLNTWTSCNAWRKLDVELMSKEQFEMYMEVTGRQLNDLLTEPHCRVLRESAKLYYVGTSPKQVVGC